MGEDCPGRQAEALIAASRQPSYCRDRDIRSESQSLSEQVAVGLPLRSLGPPTSTPSFTWANLDLNRVEEAMYLEQIVGL